MDNDVFGHINVATYTAPAPGTDTLTCTVTDHLGETSSSTVAITVDAGPALAAATSAKVGYCQAVKAGTVTAGFASDTLTLATTTAGRGVLSLSGGVLTYTVSATGGADSIGYTVTDQLGDTVTSTFAATVDRGPIAAPGKVTVGHDQTRSLTALLFGLITPGLASDTETITALSAKVGTATLTAGTFGYEALITEIYTVTYTLTGQLGEVATGTVAVNVDPGPKVTGVTVAKVGHGQTETAATVLPGITGDQVSLATLTAGLGSLSLANGVVSYMAPSAGGPDSIGYQATDQYGDAVKGTFITQVDPGPIAGTLSTTSKLGATTDVTSAILGVDKAGLAGDVLSLLGIGTTGTLGAVTFAKGHITYAATGAALAAAVAHGSVTDSFAYTVRD